MNVLCRNLKAASMSWRHLLPATAVLIMFVPGCFDCFGSGDYDDFDTELSSWRQEAQDPDSFCNVRIAGECDGNILFLHGVDIDASLTLFFDGDTGRFLWQRSSGFFCRSTNPFAPQCRNGVVTEVLCGTQFYEVGDAFR